mgnify:CR=1 FL=1
MPVPDSLVNDPAIAGPLGSLTREDLEFLLRPVSANPVKDVSESLAAQREAEREAQREAKAAAKATSAWRAMSLALRWLARMLVKRERRPERQRTSKLMGEEVEAAKVRRG